MASERLPISWARPVRRDPRPIAGALVIAAVCVWNVTRARTQSITFDEAATYNDFVVRGAAYIRQTFHTNNHTLHSLLVRFSTNELGPSHLSLRLPALAGGLIYLLAGEWLVRSNCRRPLTYVLTLLALVANPLVLDYMVASRGYALALGCFMAAIAFSRREIGPRARHARGPGHLLRYGLIGLLCCLSVAANLSFAFANAALLMVFFAWAGIGPLWGEGSASGPGVSMARIAGPLEEGERGARPAAKWWWAAAKGLVLAGPGGWVYLQINPGILHHFSRSALYLGAKNWRGVYRGLAEPLLEDLNPLVAGGAWRGVWIRLADVLIVFLALVVALYVAFVLAPGLWASVWQRREREGPREPAGRRERHELARSWLFVASVFLVTLALHQVGHWLLGIPLPLERTGIFIATMALLLIGLSVEGLTEAASPRVLAVGGQIGLAALVVTFAACLRTNYFHSWKYGATSREMYGIALDYSRRHDIGDLGVDWLFDPTFRFYRTFYRDKPPPEFTFLWPGHTVPAKQLYVLPGNSPLVEQEELKVVYADPLSGAMLAARQ